MNRKELGQKAEDAAAEFLQKKKYKILERNVRLPMGEIDIVAEINGTVIFVEVKAGSGDPNFDPMIHYDNRKQHKQIQLAQSYLSRSHHENGRFDLIVVQHINNAFKIDHFEDVIEDRTI